MLTWDEERGYGHYPVKQEDRPYDAAYFEKYRKMANTPIGHALTKARVDLVRKYYPGFNLVDVGIGSGQFVTASGMLGYDVNPAGVEWLNQRNRFADMYAGQYDAMTFWDSLEHIDDMSAAVRHIAALRLSVFRCSAGMTTCWRQNISDLTSISITLPSRG